MNPIAVKSANHDWFRQMNGSTEVPSESPSPRSHLDKTCPVYFSVRRDPTLQWSSTPVELDQSDSDTLSPYSGRDTSSPPASGSFPADSTRSNATHRPIILQPSGLLTTGLTMANDDEPPATATVEEIKSAYKVAFETVRQLQRHVSDCTSPELPRLQSKFQLANGKAQRLLTLLTALETYGELDRRVAELSNRADAQEARVEIVNSIAEQALSKASDIEEQFTERKDEVSFLQAAFQNIQKNLERVEGKIRKRSVIVNGLQPGEPYEAVEHLLKNKPGLWHDVDEAFFMGQSQNRRPLHLTFTNISSCEACLSYSHSFEFTQAFPQVSIVRDRSELRRTGISRLGAVASCLHESFPEMFIHQHFEFATLGSRRIRASEFAGSAIVIDDHIFEIEEACEANDSHEVNEALFVRMGDVMIKGYKRKGRQTTVSLRLTGGDRGTAVPQISPITTTARTAMESQADQEWPWGKLGRRVSMTHNRPEDK